MAPELIGLIFILGSRVAGRLFLGRPWIVEAVLYKQQRQSVSFPVKSRRRAGEAAAELARVIAATGDRSTSECPNRGKGR